MLPDISEQRMDVEILTRLANQLRSGEKTGEEIYEELVKDRPNLKIYFQIVLMTMTNKYGFTAGMMIWMDIIGSVVPLFVAYDNWYESELEKQKLEDSPWGDLFDGNDSSQG